MDAAKDLSPILLVDDDVKLVDSLVELFSTKGIHADRAYSGREALAVLQSRQGTVEYRSSYYKAVVLDVMMETPTAGLDILSDIRRVDKNLPVIYVTATTNESRIVSAIIAGVVLGLTKPIPFQTLYYCILSVVKYAQVHTRFLEEQLAYANKQLVVNKLFNHSVKNLAFGGQLYLQPPDPDVDKARGCFARIHEETHRLMAMTTEPSAADNTPDLATAWTEVRNHLAGSPQLRPGALNRVRLDVPVPIPALHIKPDTLAAVLGELVYNALVHNTRDVHVTVTATPVENGQVVVRVEDDGEGVLPDRQSGLFNVRDKRAEHGLGLPYCYQVARTHGGDLVYSPPTAQSHGAFVLTLRAYQPGYPGREDA